MNTTSYRGEDASEEFVRRFEKDCIRLREIMVKTYKPMSLTKGERKEFRKNSICHICEEKIEGEVKVRDQSSYW